jgi:chromate reductase
MNMPAKVKEFKSKIKEADAILIATPEYNYSVPRVLKNAIDSASGPCGDNPFNDKPVAIISVQMVAKQQLKRRQSRLRRSGTKLML